MFLLDFDPFEIVFLFGTVCIFSVFFSASLPKLILIEVVSISSLFVAPFGRIVIDIALLLDL